jgi:hypothetical protein
LDVPFTEEVTLCQAAGKQHAPSLQHSQQGPDAAHMPVQRLQNGDVMHETVSGQPASAAQAAQHMHTSLAGPQDCLNRRFRLHGLRSLRLLDNSAGGQSTHMQSDCPALSTFVLTKTYFCPTPRLRKLKSCEARRLDMLILD